MSRIVAIFLMMIVLLLPCGVVAQISFQGSTSHNFGEVNSREEARHTFKFINQSESPVVILDSRTSCSCIKVTAPSHPIMGGDSAKIEVRYRAGRKDRGRFSKVIEILTNTEPSKWLLTVTGEAFND